MRFTMVWWLRHAFPVIAMWIIIAQTSEAAPAQEPSDGRISGGSSVAGQGHDGQRAVETATGGHDAAGDVTPAEAVPSGGGSVLRAVPQDRPADGSAGGSDGDPPSAHGEEPLKPIPNPEEVGPAEIEVASFKGVTPGATTAAEVQTAWGPPREIGKQNGLLLHLYTVEPFKRVEVSFSGDKVASVVIRLNRSFPAHAVAQQLELSNIRPVLVSNELGEILGQAFPERGVLFGFEPSEIPGKATMRAVQIILEPISAEPFVLRAETLLNSRPEFSASDLEQAVRLDPSNGRARWLLARVLAGMGELAAAEAASQQAIRLAPDDPQYRVTRAQILGQLGRFAEGIEEAEKAMAQAGKRPHIQARAMCLLGDLLSSGPQPDYKRAIAYHSQAIKTADPLASDPHPAIRLTAKEVLIDAHLGAAHDIAWGNWNQKETAVPRWLDRASAFAEELIENDGGTPEHRFRVAVRALAAYVGVRGKLAPTKWAEQTIGVADEMIAAAGDSPKKQQLQWDLGMALYDAVQICQMRSENDAALRYGQQAIEQLEQGIARNQDNRADLYLLGRLYFRLGAIYAVGKQDHRTAVTWFEKAVPVFDQSIAQLDQKEFGRLGETLVSMGVSYWESGQREKAVKLTERGVDLMEKAVKGGGIQPSALEVPYSNLATMHRNLGDQEKAEMFLRRASAHKDTRLK